MRTFAPYLTFLILLAALFPGGAAAEDRPVAAASQVQEDVRKMVQAPYSGDVETSLRYTHDRILQMMGGVDNARKLLTGIFKQLGDAGMKLERLEFPAEPVFVKGTENEYALVPTKSIISAGENKVESLNFQFGARKIGASEWKYVEGSRLNAQNVTQLFPDFPAGTAFPETYRKKL